MKSQLEKKVQSRPAHAIMVQSPLESINFVKSSKYGIDSGNQTSSYVFQGLAKSDHSGSTQKKIPSLISSRNPKVQKHPAKHDLEITSFNKATSRYKNQFSSKEALESSPTIHQEIQKTQVEIQQDSEVIVGITTPDEQLQDELVNRASIQSLPHTPNKLENEISVDKLFQTVNLQSNRLSTLVKNETDKPTELSLNNHREPIIFQIEADIKAKQRPQMNVDQLTFLRRADGAFIQESLGESNFRMQRNSLNYSRFLNQAQKIPSLSMTSVHSIQRLRGKNLSFQESTAIQTRPFTASLKPTRRQVSILGLGGPQLATRQGGRQIASRNKTKASLSNPQDLVKRLKSGQHKMITDTELLKRLAIHPQGPESNVVLKRNPLILQKKKFGNIQEFYQQAADNLVAVASQLELANQNNFYPTVKEIRGNNADNSYVFLDDFLNRLREQAVVSVQTATTQQQLTTEPCFSPKTYQKARRESQNTQTSHSPSLQAKEVSISSHQQREEEHKSDIEATIQYLADKDLQLLINKPQSANSVANTSSNIRCNSDGFIQTMQRSNATPPAEIFRSQENRKFNDDGIVHVHMQQVKANTTPDLIEPQSIVREELPTPLEHGLAGISQDDLARDSGILISHTQHTDEMNQQTILLQFQKSEQCKKVSLKPVCSRIQSANRIVPKTKGTIVSRNAIVINSCTLDSLEDTFEKSSAKEVKQKANMSTRMSSGALRHIHKKTRTVMTTTQQACLKKIDPHLVVLNEDLLGDIILSSKMRLDEPRRASKLQTARGLPTRSATTTKHMSAKLPAPKQNENDKVLIRDCSRAKMIHPFQVKNVKHKRSTLNKDLHVLSKKRFLSSDVYNDSKQSVVSKTNDQEQEKNPIENLLSTQRHSSDRSDEGTQRHKIDLKQSSGKWILPQRNEVNTQPITSFQIQSQLSNTMPKAQLEESLNLQTYVHQVDMTRTESQKTVPYSAQYGYLLTGWNLIEMKNTVGPLSSADEVQKAFQESNLGEEAKLQQHGGHTRNKPGLSGLLYHRHFSSHHKGLPMTQAAAQKQRVRKAKTNIGKIAGVQVVNSHVQMRKKQNEKVKIQSQKIEDTTEVNNQPQTAKSLSKDHSESRLGDHLRSQTTITTNQLMPMLTLNTALDKVLYSGMVLSRSQKAPDAILFLDKTAEDEKLYCDTAEREKSSMLFEAKAPHNSREQIKQVEIKPRVWIDEISRSNATSHNSLAV